jgi:hypothetical protein
MRASASSLLMDQSISFTIFLIIKMDGSGSAPLEEDTDWQSRIEFGLVEPKGNVANPKWGSVGRWLSWFGVFSHTKEVELHRSVAACCRWDKVGLISL